MDSILISSLLSILYYSTIPSDGFWQLLNVLEYVPPFTLVPRFILSLRALYARDLQRIRGGDIDTAFGLTSRSGYDVAASAIVFAEAGENEGLVQSEGEVIQLEERNNTPDIGGGA